MKNKLLHLLSSVSVCMVLVFIDQFSRRAASCRLHPSFSLQQVYLKVPASLGVYMTTALREALKKVSLKKPICLSHF